MPPITAFITGLTTGGLTCLAVQGGLLVGLLARRQAPEQNERLSRWQIFILPVVAFLAAKLVSHTVLGFGLGWLGDSIQISTTARLWLQVFAGLFMVLAGIRLVVPHWLPWLTLTPPAAVRRLIRRSAKSQALVAPAILGFLTILIPCGTTQAMELAAIATGSPLQAASIMFAFVLGTAPLFFLVGILAKGTSVWQRRLSYVAAALVVGFGFYSLNGVLVATDSPYEFKNVVASVGVALAGESSRPANAGGTAATTNPTIVVKGAGYSPNQVTVPAGRPVTLTLKTSGTLGCTSIFRIPKLNVEENLTKGPVTKVTLNFPKAGRYTFTCGMGMYSGTINAV